MNTYLSATKYILLVAIDQYSCVDAEQTQLAEFLVSHVYAPSTPTTPLALAKSSSSICVDNTTLQHKLCECMDEHLESIDSLHGFFDKVRKLVGEQVDEESMLGVFVRRCWLAFSRMEFYVVGKFLGECRHALRVMQSGSDVEFVDPEPSSELELHVDRLISALESHTPIPSITHAFRASASPHVHYLTSLDFARQRESSSSESSLRQFFDRHDGAHGHHALLHLAALRTQLMSNDAQNALDEARHIARDCQDTRALLFIACWECRLLVERGQSEGREAENAVRAFIESAVCDAELQTVGYLMLCDVQSMTEGNKVFETLERVRALATTHNTRRTATHIAHSRVWLHFNSLFLAQLFAQSARSLAEHEQSQMRELLMQCQLKLCERVDHGTDAFIDPVCTNSVCDTREWLRVEGNADIEDVDGEIADVWARRLREARRLMNDGFVAEAASALNEIVYCPTPMPSDRAVRIAQQMLVSYQC
ncbi:hypothetical protein GGH12_003936 [Coemansia sp. RSA 1822]|nr:hypothetical protein LPJ76_001701 [Coemansia sp. RSA 638]KAJ2543571.1 hypothetical protein GGF49_001969 [Coemansia sp. RSA 1853]KAJ2561516.1 hypothetical protein GGH12_003936 [Coemansia sp. RSA 1822]